jgi:hypothetical protein
LCTGGTCQACSGTPSCSGRPCGCTATANRNACTRPISAKATCEECPAGTVTCEPLNGGIINCRDLCPA